MGSNSAGRFSSILKFKSCFPEEGRQLPRVPTQRRRRGQLRCPLRSEPDSSAGFRHEARLLRRCQRPPKPIRALPNARFPVQHTWVDADPFAPVLHSAIVTILTMARQTTPPETQAGSINLKDRRAHASEASAAVIKWVQQQTGVSSFVNATIPDDSYLRSAWHKSWDLFAQTRRVETCLSRNSTDRLRASRVDLATIQ